VRQKRDIYLGVSANDGLALLACVSKHGLVAVDAVGVLIA